MVYWNMQRKLRGHRSLLGDKRLIAAIYGLGEAVLRMADSAAEGLTGSATGDTSSFDGPSIYANEFEAATEGRHREGLAADIEGNGVMGLTDQRLLWFKKATVIGRPGEPTAVIPLDSIVATERLESMVRVEFADGSIAALHVPRSQKPAAFVEALNRLLADRH